MLGISLLTAPWTRLMAKFEATECRALADDWLIATGLEAGFECADREGAEALREEHCQALEATL
eukprot:2156619-Alexandrium_andersonii.AAC.1